MKMMVQYFFQSQFSSTTRTLPNPISLISRGSESLKFHFHISLTVFSNPMYPHYRKKQCLFKRGKQKMEHFVVLTCSFSFSSASFSLLLFFSSYNSTLKLSSKLQPTIDTSLFPLHMDRSEPKVMRSDKVQVMMTDEGDKKKKGKGSGSGSGTGTGSITRCCQAEKCNADLHDAKQYHRRHKVCEYHAKAQVVLVGGTRQRFCQQCSRFHELGEFDDTKRSCRRRLAGHNERRRKNSESQVAAEGSSRKGMKDYPRKCSLQTFPDKDEFC